MQSAKELGANELYQPCNLDEFTFETSADLEDLSQVIGQPRAVEAVQFSIGIEQEGYNLFVLGSSGVGRHSLVRQYFTEKAVSESTPADWAYINNFSETYRPSALARRPLQTLTLERQLRAQATTLRRMLMRVAKQHKLPWSFQVVRGVIATEVNKATSETDLVILGRSRRTRTGANPLGSTSCAIVVQAPPRLTLVLQRQIPRKQPVLVGYDGSNAAQRALLLATQLLREQAAPLILILISDEAAQADALRQEVANWLRLHGIEARYHWLARANIERLVNLVLMEQGGAFVLPSEGLNLHDAALLTILDLMQCPVLLVR